MKLSEKRNSNFTPHPATDEPIKAVLVDVTELKKRMTAFGEKDEFRLVFETECMDTENTGDSASGQGATRPASTKRQH